MCVQQFTTAYCSEYACICMGQIIKGVECKANESRLYSSYNRRSLKSFKQRNMISYASEKDCPNSSVGW